MNLLLHPELRLKIARYRHAHSVVLGYVIVYGESINGWIADLTEPELWCPGTIAVGPLLQCWIAVGGNHETGATSWTQRGVELAEGFRE